MATRPRALCPGARTGPLPWLSTAPDTLHQDPEFGPWLTRRATLVTDLANQVRDHAVSQPTTPIWVTAGARMPDTATVVDVEVWRAAMGIDPADRRPTGPMQVSRLAFEHQIRLLARLRDGQAPALAEWRDTLHDINPALARDPYIGHLAEHLAGLSRANVDTRGVLRTAVAAGPLPDDHAASALWWRITRILTRDALTAAHQRPDTRRMGHPPDRPRRPRHRSRATAKPVLAHPDRPRRHGAANAGSPSTTSSAQPPPAPTWTTASPSSARSPPSPKDHPSPRDTARETCPRQTATSPSRSPAICRPASREQHAGQR